MAAAEGENNRRKKHTDLLVSDFSLNLSLLKFYKYLYLTLCCFQESINSKMSLFMLAEEGTGICNGRS